MKYEHKIELLKRVPLFQCLDDSMLGLITEKARLKSFHKKEQHIIYEGDEEDFNLYIICEGQTKVVTNKRKRDGTIDETKEIVLSLLKPHQYFGEISLLDKGPRPASVITLEPTTTLVIHDKNFDQVILEDPKARVQLIKDLSIRFRDATNKIASMAYTDGFQRVAQMLAKYSKPHGNIEIVEPKFNQQDIASIVGLTREMVSRVMSRLKKKGYIEINKEKHILIKRPLPFRSDP